jgi:two-component system nitrogen regulation sensor histidine kinase GlnL
MDGSSGAAGLDPTLLLAALPDPIIAIDRQGVVRFVNPAAEQFLGVGAPALRGASLSDFVAPRSPLFGLVETVWRDGGSIAEYDVLLEGPRLPPRPVTIQGAPVGEGADILVLALHERAIAEQMDRQFAHRDAARSMTAMAAMLAHEVKNPLSGIRGAAQLLEQDADDSGRQLTQLICDETDRIVALVDRMEAFSDHQPIARPRSTFTKCWSGCGGSRSQALRGTSALVRNTTLRCRPCTAIVTCWSRYS